MSKSRKKKTEKSHLCLSSDNKQTSLSKYFFSAAASKPDLRRRLISDEVNDECPQKIPKICTDSEELSDLEPKSMCFPRTDLDDELEQNNHNLNKASEASENSKSKLSHFTFYKHSKSTEKSAMVASELIKNEQPKENYFDFAAFVEMDTSEESSPIENNNNNASPIKKDIKYTPLEKQYLVFQDKYPDAVLLIECGYKYRFFGKDAKIAYNDLNIGCYKYHNFLSASIPVHRLHYHVRRLVLKGHKVGVIKQTESTALKAASDTRNELFSRELHCMYSKSTFIEDELSVLNDENSVVVDDTDSVSGFLVCINQTKTSKHHSDKPDVNIACVALQVSSGDIFYSSFQENLFQNELESFLLCVNPSEILLPSSQLSKETEILIKSFSCNRSVRIERLDDKTFEHSSALSNMTSFISSHADTQENLQMLLSLPPLVISCLSALKIYLTDFKVENILKDIKNIQLFSTIDHMTLNSATIRSLEIIRNSSGSSNHGTLFWCLNQTLTKFGERLLKSWIVKPLKNIQVIEERLNIITEIIHSDSVVFKRLSGIIYKLPDLERLLCLAFYHKVSMFHCYLFFFNFLRVIEERLNIITEIIHSDSVVFKRLSGIIYKLPDLERLLCLAFYHKVSMFHCYLFFFNFLRVIEERLNIITEIIHSDSVVFKRLSGIIYKLPDLERLLCLAFYHKCNCNDFLKLVKALVRLKNELIGLFDRINTEIEVLKLKNILFNILKYLDDIEIFSSNIDPEAAKEGNKIKLFLDISKYTSMEKCKSKICDIEKKLSDLRPGICKILRLPAFKYATVAGQKYLIEVPNGHLSLVPDEWLKISVTKQVSRFRSPEVIELCKELDQEQERLQKFANEAWEKFLNEFGQKFYKYKRAISCLAQLDVYMALAKVSKDQNYCRPLFTSDSHNFDIKQGRHPVVVKLMGEENQFVANDVNLNDIERCLIVTGPNMGGKSTYIRQIALIALIAHMGCFVPADSATIPLFDGIYVRMGADDDIVNQMSTFMSEMSEASSILSCATSKSLVIFDELGRGTSTNDGAAIAFATLKYLIRDVKCLTLFVTHYRTVLELKNYHSENILTVHMAYILKELDDDDDDIQTVTFLYNVVSGVSEKSYGINVAALAGISKDILIKAQAKSKEMEYKMIIQRQLRKLLQKMDSISLEKVTNMKCIS